MTSTLKFPLLDECKTLDGGLLGTKTAKNGNSQSLFSSLVIFLATNINNSREKHRLLIVRTALFKDNKKLRTQTKGINGEFDDFRQNLEEWCYS